MSTLLERIRQGVRRLGIEAPHPQICVVAPSNGSHGFLRRRLLAENGDGFLRVRFTEPDLLVAQIGEPDLVRRGLAREPPGWLESQVAVALRELEAGEPSASYRRYLEHLRRPGWLPFLANAVERLEGAGVTAAGLGGVRHDRDRPRLELVTALLHAVEVGRERDGVFGAADVARSALAAMAGDRVPRPVARDDVIVVYGDRALAPRSFDALSTWLGQRPGLRLVFMPHESAPEATTGLRLAARSAGYLEVETADSSDPTLARAQRRLFAPAPSGREDAHDAGSPGAVRFIEALDDVREAREVVRVVLQALEAGAPLDGVAIALPTTSRSALLCSELDRAGVPASVIAGPPLAETGVARALIAAFELDAARVEPEALHHLLQHPELRVPGRGGLRPAGSGRWRRFLVEVGPARGFAAIRDRLVELRNERFEDDAQHPDLHPLTDLIDAVQDLKRAVELPDGGTWTTYRDRFAAFVGLWFRRSDARSCLLELLGATDAHDRSPPAPTSVQPGPVIGPDLARSLLRGRLEREAVRSGGLNEPAVRVVPPLALVGSRFHTVIVPGLTDTAFPAPPAADAILDDDLVHALNDQLNARLETSAIGEELERRRLAAIVGAADRQLVFTFPRRELIAGRALQPSPYLGEVAAALGGRRSREGWLALVERPDVDGVGTIADPAQAANPSELRLAHLAVEPEAAIDMLAAAPMSRGLLEAAVSRERLADELQAGTDARLDAHTGWVPPDLLPSDLFERSWSSHALARLVEAPALFFFRDVLGARSLRWFPRPLDPWSAKVNEAPRVVAEEAFGDAGPWSQAREAAAQRWLSEHGDAKSPASQDMLRDGLRLASARWDGVLDRVHQRGRLEADAAVEESLPWKLRPEAFALDHDRALMALVRKREDCGQKLEKVLAPAIRALAATTAGWDIAAVRTVHPDSPNSKPAPDAVSQAFECLTAATEDLRQGWWPTRGRISKSSPPHALAADVDVPPGAHLRGQEES